MRFDDPIHDEDEPIQPVSIVPPVDRRSSAIRIKLFMLFAMLIMVVVAMKEAGKPERWEWMGFDKSKTVEVDIRETDQSLDLNQSASDENRAAIIADRSDADPGSTPEPPITISSNQFASSTGNQLNPSVSSIDFSVDESDYPVAAVAFWNNEFVRLGSDEQKSLLRLLKNMRQGQSTPLEQQAVAQQVVRRIRGRRDQYHQTLFDQLALVADGTPEKTRLASEMFESQDIWDKKILPAIDAASHGEDFTMGQRQAILKLQLVLDRIVFQQVQDGTSIGWKGDSAAWIRIWEKVIGGEKPDFQPVTRIELMGQPKLYRGNPVAVEGWVRSAKKKMLGPESELGLTHYFILWIRPKETKLGPFCVYSMTLPDGFPPVSESFTDVNEHVRIRGYSFKVRNYVAADSQVDTCPVLLASGLEPINIPAFTSVNRWQPSRTTLTAAFILIPLLATGLAWLAFRNSKTHQYVPGKNATRRIEQSLGALADDPAVQTDREKIMSLYESSPQND